LLLCFNVESGVYHHHVSLFKPCLQDNASVVVALHLSSTLRLLEGLQIIMVLKRNTRQITFLHVYHHSSIALIWWIIAYHAPGGEAYFSAALNSGVHVFMYLYYFLAAVLRGNEKVRRKYLFWGK
jgi:hypothetical protein